MITEHMLLIEDEPAVCGNVERLLVESFSGYEVDSADSVSAGKRVFEQRRKEGYVTRAVIVDEKLGTGGRGSDFLKFIHDKYPGIRKIMLSAHAEPADLSRAINYGHVDKYILKRDFLERPAVLCEAIKDTLGDGEGAIYDAMTELLRDCDDEDNAVLLAAGKKLIAPSELLQCITQGTPEGREHLKRLAKLIYSALRQPELFVKEIAEIDALQGDTRAGSNTKQRPRQTGRPKTKPHRRKG